MKVIYHDKEKVNVALAIMAANTLLCFGAALAHGNGWWPAAANGVAAVFFAWRVAASWSNA